MKNTYKIIFLLLISGLGLYSCNDMLDVKPDEVLLQEDYLGTDVIEARSALFGVLGQLQDVSKQYLVLGELRADLMDVTSESVDELRQINDHNVISGNSLTDPSGLFSIINNCNFALQGIDTVDYDVQLKSIYASILRVRTWAHLQIAINYGEVPYITKPISGVADVSKKYPMLTMSQALDSLINGLIPFINIDNASTYQNSLGYSIYNLIPDKDLLMGDLLLWANNYAMAATAYKAFLDRNVASGGNKYNLTSTYRISVANSTTSITTVNWMNIFGETIATDELITYIPFSLQYRQPNSSYKLIEDYQVKPSNEIRYNWASQVVVAADLSTKLGDYRSSLSVDYTAKGVGIGKFQYGYMILNRAANVYLKYAEAINRAGYPLHALYLLNQGPKDDATAIGAPRFIGNVDNFLNFTQTQYYTVNSSGKSTNGNLGVRGRVGLAPVGFENALNLADSIKQVEKLILNESALESAFEGHRWPDLLRISLRSNDPSILANAVYNKFSLAGSPLASSIKSKLLDKNNWYLDLDAGSSFVEVGN